MFLLRRLEDRHDRIERRVERRYDMVEARRDVRAEVRYERRANLEAERHLMHLQRLGYDPRSIQTYGGVGPGQTAGYLYPPAHVASAPGAYGSGPAYTHPAQYASPPQQALAPAGGYRGPPYPPPAGYDNNNARPAQFAPPPGPPPNTRAISAPYDTTGQPSPVPPEYYPHNVAYVAQNGVHVEHEDTKKKWFELDEGKRNALSAGGLIIGLAAVAGGAYYVYQKHKKEGEAMKAQAWEVQNWMMTSDEKSMSFLHSKDGPKEPTSWIYSAHIDEVKKYLIPGGEEAGQPWYIARAPHEGGLLVGKCRPEAGAFIGADKEAVQVKAYDVLIGNKNAVKWVKHKGPLNVAELGAQPIEGGHESDGTHVAIARAFAEDKVLMGIGGTGVVGLFLGKISSKMDGAYVTIGEKEVMVKEYEVLCYA